MSELTPRPDPATPTRVNYDRDGPRYAGENPPDQTAIQDAFTAAILAVVKGALA